MPAKDGSERPVSWWRFEADEIPPHRTCEVDDVPLMQPVGFVWHSKPRHRVKAQSRIIQ